MTDPKVMCKKHLLGEHVECHMFVGTLKKHISVDGYITGGLLDLDKLVSRHEELVKEMTRRDWSHYSEIGNFDASYVKGNPCINVEANLTDLRNRCTECRRLQSGC